MTIIFLYGSDERSIAAAAIAGLIISLFIALYHKSKNKRTEKEQLKATALDNLKDKGIISEQEYNDKINEIQDKYLSSKIKSTKEYRQLIELKKEGLLNDNDFRNKFIHNLKLKIMAILNGYLLPTTCLMVPNEDDQKSKVGIINVFMKYLQNISEIRKLVDEVEKMELNNEDFTYREVNFMYVETSTFKRKSK